MLKPIALAALLTFGAVAAYGQTSPPRPASQTPNTASAPATERTVSTGDFNVSGDMSASAVIGAKVRNANKETIGKIDDIYVDKDGNIKTLVISVGGFLGVGAKTVAVKWTEITFGRDDKSVMLTTSLTKEALDAMPDYTKAERRVVVPAETANAPPAKPAAPR
jgi:sporulation protein YlmC with PRC-barrel domain